MADQRVTVPARIIDGADPTKEAAVDALADALANPTSLIVGALAGFWNGATWDRMRGTTADGLLVNLGANNDVTISGAVDTELPAAAALADNFANPTAPAVGAFGMVYDGTNWDRLRGDAENGLLVNLGANNDVTFTETDPTGATIDTDKTTDTAAGASADLESAELTETEYLESVYLTASVPFKAIIKKVANGVATEVGTVFGRAGETVAWRPPHRKYVSVGASAGVDCFRATMTNLDGSDSADLYASFFYRNN